MIFQEIHYWPSIGKILFDKERECSDTMLKKKQGIKLACMEMSMISLNNMNVAVTDV